MLIGHDSGRTRMPNSASTSSSKSNGSLPSRSILLINTITGVLRMRHTSISRRVCVSTPLAASMTIITESTAVKVRNVSSAKSWCPGVSRILIWNDSASAPDKVGVYSKPITDVATEMPRCFSISIQSDVAVLRILLDLTAPATWIAPPYSSSFSVRVVLPASGCEMIAKVRLRRISSV